MPTLDRFWHDLRHGVRMFVKMPAFTFVAVVSIAFGTGANVAIFSAVDALLLRPAPIPHADDYLTIGSRVDRGLGTVLRMSHADYLDLRARAQSFQGLIGFESHWVGFAASARTPARIKIATLVSANYFPVLGLQPALGRAFLPEEDEVPGRDAVAMLSHDLWQREYGGDAGVIGRSVRIAGFEFTIIGVGPKGFSGLDPYTRDAVYVPLAMMARVLNLPQENPLEDRSFRQMTVKGRLASGITDAVARDELTAIGRALAEAYPDTNRRSPLAMQTELQMRFDRRPIDTRALMLLAILSMGVLCVACANVAGLLVSRAPVRAREIAVRLAIGAGRGRIITQLVTESVCIAVAGGLGGIAVGYAGIGLLRQIDFASEVFAYPEIALDQRTLAFSIVAAVASVFLFGIGPAIQTARVNLAHAVKTSDVAPPSRRLRGRGALVAVQVAVSLVLLTLAVFTFQIFNRDLDTGPGFRMKQMAMAVIDPGQARYGEQDTTRFFENVIARVRELPGAVSVTMTSHMPLWSVGLMAMVPEGYRLDEGQTGLRLFGSSVSEAYFDTMAIPIVQGRAFRDTDDATAPRVAVVNETLARHYWPDRSAVGQRFRLTDGKGPWIEIVGVAKTSTYLYTGEPAYEVAYFPFRQQPRSNMVLLVQSSGDSASQLAPIAEVVRRLDGDVPLYNVQTVEHFHDARFTSIGRISVKLVGGMGVMGMTLTMVGLYGLVSYAVSRRTREIGIRMAIGATPGRMLSMFVHQGMAPAWIGLASGMLLSTALAKFLPSLLPIGPRIDITTMLVVVPMLLFVIVLATILPARRASKVDPTEALRYE